MTKTSESKKSFRITTRKTIKKVPTKYCCELCTVKCTRCFQILGHAEAKSAKLLHAANLYIEQEQPTKRFYSGFFECCIPEGV
mmetsp:Transcript_44821/g.68554  ORF Transcript_44821/g.68554 Transcript_44821/m.68554 type:complete len:83 (+) Transcript_44821:3-251(+)